ncbi:MAG: class B sortase [Oscillospiraceae bacterium]|nr:class B sortase [Oscillospiraceae bacterium]
MKKAVSILVLTAVLFGATACGKTPPDDNTTPDESATVTTVVTAGEKTADASDSKTESPPDVPVTPPAILDEYVENYERNNDVVGHFIIENTKVNYPLLQSDDGNDYYLTHNIDKNPDKRGSMVLDYKCSLAYGAMTDNTMIHGHNNASDRDLSLSPISRYYHTTRNNTMSFYKSTPVVHVNSLYEKMEWKVFAMLMLNTQPQHGDIIYFWNVTDFTDEQEFNDYIMMIMDKSVLHTDVDLQYGDQIMTAATCYYPGPGIDARFVLFARKVRPGESSEVDVDKAYWNKSEFAFGSNSGTRTWDTSYLTSYKGDPDAPADGKSIKYK